MKIHPPTRRINTFTNLAETDIVNFTPSGKINGMSNRTRHTRRKQTFSTLKQTLSTFTPSGKINGMSDRYRHTRRKQTFSTLKQTLFFFVGVQKSNNGRYGLTRKRRLKVSTWPPRGSSETVLTMSVSAGCVGCA